MEFRFVGFGIRVWPWYDGYYVDDTGWDINDQAETELGSRFNISENSWQLWEAEDLEEFTMLCDFALNREDINISTVEIPIDIVRQHDQIWQTSYANSTIDFNRFSVRCFDICDHDGWFSAMHHPDFFKVSGGSLEVNRIDRAVELISIANQICSEHAPHSIAKIRTLK